MKYTILDNQPKFEEIKDDLHPDLYEALKVNNYTYMTPIQQEVII